MRSTGVMFAMCCMLVAPARGRYLEAVIMLPDTLGPLNGPYCLAWDDNPAHPCLYIGGESYSGGVMVAEAITCKRLAMIPTGPVAALCFVPTHNTLYVAKASCDTIAVVDCATNQIVSMVSVAGEAPALQYNRANDRLYCGGNSISVLDCAADTVIHAIALAATFFALDSIDNKLYAGRGGPLSVIDCAADSVIAIIPGIDAAAALCFNPTAGKVYVTSGDTLYAIQASVDSIVARLPFAGLAPVLACDPQRNRIYCVHEDYWSSVDCACDSVTLTTRVGQTASFMACNVARDRLYLTVPHYSSSVAVYDATTGQCVTAVKVDGIASGAGWCPGLDRLYCLPQLMTEPYYHQSCLLSAVSGAGDSIAGVVPLTMHASSLSVDSVDNRLYFAYQDGGLGVVGVADCQENTISSYTYAGEVLGPICFNANNDRLYWNAGAGTATGGFVAVYDCSRDSVLKRIPYDDRVEAFQLHPGLNRLYGAGYDSLGQRAIVVIDCGSDSVTRRIVIGNDRLRRLLIVPEDDRLWYLGVYHVVAVDCQGDSIVAEAAETLGVADACASSDERKIFAACGDRPFSVIDMDDPAHVETLFTVRADGGQLVTCVPNAHKVYWASMYNGPYPGKTFFRIIDSRSNVVTDSFWASRQVAGMCLDHTGDYVYCTGYEDSVMLVLDACGDSVVAAVRLPSLPAGQPVLNTRTNFIYAAQYRVSSGIPVVRDSIVVGIEEPESGTRSLSICPSMVSRSAPLRSAMPAELFDAFGRRAGALRLGLNDISRLAAGVYFVREEPQASSFKPHAVRKIVIAR